MVRTAAVADFNEIIETRKALALHPERLGDNNYRLRIQRDGFLLRKTLTQEQFIEKLDRYIVSEDDGKVNGYLRLDTEQELETEEEVVWFKPELKNIYFSQPHADIGGVGVLPGSSKHGVATRLLNSAEEQARKTGAPYLFSFVIISPVTNMASIMFHERNGFERVAVLAPASLFELENFQSIVYAKQLQ